jgi:hypothetical protein
LKNNDKIRECGKTAATPVSALKLGSARSYIMIEKERLLASLIRKSVQCHVSLSSAIIQEETITLYSEPFTGSKRWFQRFRKHANLQNIILQCESASANKEGATNLI